MQSLKFSILSLFLFLLLLASCSLDNSSNFLADWKNKNDSFFASMKDSVGYSLDSVQSSSGGGIFYYKVITPGDPKSVSPREGGQVVLDYRGKMINGVPFAQNYTGATVPPDSLTTPSVFAMHQLPVDGLIWNLIHMKVGEIRFIVLPQQLGYGPPGWESILPFSTTLWIIKLVKVNY
jgi:FKBP-type peptidyl-prolyl cis-trans isomerase